MVDETQEPQNVQGMTIDDPDNVLGKIREAKKNINLAALHPQKSLNKTVKNPNDYPVFDSRKHYQKKDE